MEGLWIKQAPLELFLADGTASLIWNGVFKFRFRICGIASLDGFLNISTSPFPSGASRPAREARRSALVRAETVLDMPRADWRLPCASAERLRSAGLLPATVLTGWG